MPGNSPEQTPEAPHPDRKDGHPYGQDHRLLRLATATGRVAIVAIAVWPPDRPDAVMPPEDYEVADIGDRLRKMLFHDDA